MNDERVRVKSGVRSDDQVNGSESSRSDGRNARRETNRLLVIDAYLDLVQGGNPFPSVDELSERSGVSHRSVFRYFTDRGAMARASIERQHERMKELIDRHIDPDSAFDRRADELIEKRLDFHQVAWPTAQLCRVLALTQPVVQDELTTNRAKLRAEVKRTFRNEFRGLSVADARETLALLDVTLSLEAIDLLKRDQAFSRPRVTRTLHRAVVSILRHK